VGEVVDYYLSKLEKSVASTVITPAALPDDDVHTLLRLDSSSQCVRACVHLPEPLHQLHKADDQADKRKSSNAWRNSKRQTTKLGKVAAALRAKPGFEADDVSKLPTTVNQEVRSHMHVWIELCV
jgi:hypothetical protein